MATSESQLRRRISDRRKRRGGFWAWLFMLLVIVAVCWGGWVYHEIEVVAQEDQAQPADAIAVFGAAEYAGRPSPVLHARLDKAVELYQHQIAPLVITLGGGGDKDAGLTEGGVGRDYLLANGIPYEHIVAETESVDTEQQVQRLAQIAQERHLAHIVVVSDGTHLFRIRELCRQAGVDVYTSPRALVGHIDGWDYGVRVMHEVLSYTSLRLHLHLSWMHRWLEGKDDL